MPTTAQDREQAKRIILEIIRQAGGEFRNKTNMYKAFWKAHIEYARRNPGYLTLWPIVRMPNGPGIHDFDRLIADLVEEGALAIEEVQLADFTAFRFKLTEKGETVAPLSPEEAEAVRAGVEYVQGRTAASVSNDSHFESTSWRDSRDGDELNIYIDLLSEEEYQAKKQKLQHLSEAFDVGR